MSFTHNYLLSFTSAAVAVAEAVSAPGLGVASPDDLPSALAGVALDSVFVAAFASAVFPSLLVSLAVAAAAASTHLAEVAEASPVVLDGCFAFVFAVVVVVVVVVVVLVLVVLALAAAASALAWSEAESMLF